MSCYHFMVDRYVAYLVLLLSTAPGKVDLPIDGGLVRAVPWMSPTDVQLAPPQAPQDRRPDKNP